MKPNPIYEKCRAANGEKTVYVSLTDTAKLIRATLKAKFPDIKFSVRSERYSGGSSIRASWLDGPLGSAVQEVITPYAGKGFDGMIDMDYLKGAWLYPDGSAGFRKSDGTAYSAGSVSAYRHAPANPDALPVSFWVSYVFAERRISAGYLSGVLEDYAKVYGDELADAIRAGKVTATGDDGYAHMSGANGIRVGNDWADVAIYRFDQERAALLARVAA